MRSANRLRLIVARCAGRSDAHASSNVSRKNNTVSKIKISRLHWVHDFLLIKTEKSRFTVTVTLPILPVLAETLAAGPCGDLTFITGERGQPLTRESFGNMFHAACREAGVPGSAHGVRKIAATRAANHGATVARLEAIFGWTDGTMASLYTPLGRQAAACDRRDAQTRERSPNIYSRT